jgi:uncharacterized protein (TIGR02271 family)
MTTTQQTVIVGVFADSRQAEQARKALLKAGCRQEQIKTSMENPTGGQADPAPPRSELVRDAALGGGAGALPGMGAALLARKMNSSLASRPLWLLLLAGAAIGALAGSLAGFFVGKRMSGSQFSMQHGTGSSRTLLFIETENPETMLNILHDNGAGEMHTPPAAVQQPQAPHAAQTPAQANTTSESSAAFGGVQNPPYAPALETTSAPTLVVGAFPGRAAANAAIDALLDAGFTSEQIRYSEHGTEGGGILNHLISLGVPAPVAQPYEQEFETGHTIVTVKTLDRQQEAHFLLAKFGGYNIRQLSAQPASPSAPPLEAMQEIKLREEQLRVRKQQVQTGEVDIHRETVTEEKTITVPVTREEMVIEYHPAADQREAGAQVGEESEERETIRIPISEEQVHVTKETVQTGEVSVHKQQVQEVQHVTETVKREELHVERQGDVQIKDTTASNPAEQG